MTWQPEDDARDEAEVLEEEVIAEELAARLLQDVCADWLDGGETIAVVVGDRSSTGVVIHAGEDFLTLRSQRGEVDVRFDAIVSMAPEADGHGPAARRTAHPARFSGRLRELQATGQRVHLSGSKLDREDVLIVVVAADHLLTEFRGRALVVPMGAFDCVTRAPLKTSSGGQVQ